jgi:4-hydroxymandelate oxidase
MTSVDLFPINNIACLTDYEAAARERLPRLAYDYVSGGASDEVTLKWNEEAFQKIRLRQKVLVDVSNIDTRQTLCGAEMPFPILLAPAAYHRLLHSEGECETARGANAVGATYVVSTMATICIEEIAAVSITPLWFQLYVQPDRGFTKSLIRRAEDAGCRALCVTIDTPVIGTRYREMRLRFALPDGLDRPHLHGLTMNSESIHGPREGEIYSSTLDAKLTWKEIDWLLAVARVPVILKGVMNPDDAEIAVKMGVSGIIVSNHGARNLDTSPATIDALPEVAERVAGRLPILMDGGIRRGTDVLKAIALGANAVLIGRPYLYGLAVAGAEGVARVVNILRAEFEMAMALTGKTSIASIDRSVLWDMKQQSKASLDWGR